MPDTTVIILNGQAVEALLRQAPEQLQAELRRVVTTWLLRRQAELARYPSPPPGSTYRRTGTLGRTWTAQAPAYSASGGGFQAKIGNATPYAPYVQGRRQARVHQGRWPTVEQVAEAAAPELRAEVEQAVADLATAINRSSA